MRVFGNETFRSRIQVRVPFPVRQATSCDSVQFVALFCTYAIFSVQMREKSRLLGCMKRLIEGLQDFHGNVYPENSKIFQSLAAEQNPHVMFITCADSRIDPSLLLRGKPGDIFVTRNAGNIVPASDGDASGVAATVEYAVGGLNIRDIVVCGHSDCGAMKALLNPDGIKEYPAVARWLENSKEARRLAVESGAVGASLLRRAAEENILLQLDTLAAYPSVAASLARGEMNLYGWYYDIGCGIVHSYSPETRQFQPFNGTLSTANVRHALCEAA